MCGPWALPLALVAAGTTAKYFGEKKAASAQLSTFGAERTRQEALTGQQTAAWQDSLHHVTDMTDPAHQAAAVAAREAPLTAAITPAQGAYLPGSSSAPAIVGQAGAKADAGSNARSAGLAHALATLGGTTDQLQETGTAIGRNSGRIGQLASFKAGSAGVLDSEMRAAAHKGEFLRNLGDIAQQIGLSMAGGRAMGGARGAGPVAVQPGPSGFLSSRYMSPGPGLV